MAPLSSTGTLQVTQQWQCTAIGELTHGLSWVTQAWVQRLSGKAEVILPPEGLPYDSSRRVCPTFTSVQSHHSVKGSIAVCFHHFTLSGRTDSELLARCCPSRSNPVCCIT